MFLFVILFPAFFGLQCNAQMSFFNPLNMGNTPNLFPHMPSHMPQHGGSGNTHMPWLMPQHGQHMGGAGQAPGFPPMGSQGITFRLYTKTSGNSFSILRVNDTAALKNSGFNPKKHTYFVTHGFMGSNNYPSVFLVRMALQRGTDSNIITVDWSPLAMGYYHIVRAYVPQVGRQIGNMINFLYAHGMDPKKTTLIGHSLGAHIVGFAGKTANKKVDHIIGLDPAGPMFSAADSSQRISTGDARHVEIIHTDGGSMGFKSNLGHYDFYPNGGFAQIGCMGDPVSTCSHSRSFQYLAEQISNPGRIFCAVRCSSYTEFLQSRCTKETAEMGGINRHPAKPGQYYLRTNAMPPFSLPTQCK